MKLRIAVWQHAHIACSCALFAFIVLGAVAFFSAQTITNDVYFAIPDLGGLSLNADGSASGTTVGYAAIRPASGSTAPSGIAVTALRSNNVVLVDEFTVPAGLPIQNGRLYAEVGGAINTGIAIVNPNNQTATIAFEFTDSNGNDFGAGVANIPSNSQLVSFLNQAPFSPPI